MRACVLIGLLAFGARRSPAQSLPLPYWQHSQWIGENAPPIAGEYDLERSADGYLWLGARNGMIRFDGIRFTVMDSTNTPAFRGLRQGSFYPALLDSRGLLWIHGPGGSVFTYADGVITPVFPQESEATGSIIEDGAGRLWMRTAKRFWRIQDGRLVAHALPPALPATTIWGAERDTSDGLWIGTSDGLWHVQRDRVDRFGRGHIRALLQSRDGVVWVIGDGLGTGTGLWRLVDGHWSEVRAPDEPSRSIVARVAVEGADGSVWFVTSDLGLLRWHNGQIERFSSSDGLSNDRVSSVYADREGAVWTSTDAGLDRLRPSTFASIEKRNGFPFTVGNLFAEDTSGAIWIASQQWAYRLDGGIIRNRAGPIVSERMRIADDSHFQLISPSRFGGLWLGPTTGGVLRLTGQGLVAHRTADGFPKSRLGVAFESRDGTLWTRSLAGDLGTFRAGKYKPFPISAADRPRIDGVAEDGFGRMWFSNGRHGVTVFVGDSIVSRLVLPDHGGFVSGLTAEGGDTMWVSTSSTLIRIIGQRVTEVTPPGLQQLLVPAAQLVISQGSLWLASTSGIARIPLSELHRAADGGAAVTSVDVFGPLDGLSVAHASSQTPTKIRVGRDGRVWLATPNGLAVADPTFRMVTTHPRRVRIEEFSVGETAMPVRDSESVQPKPSRISLRFSVPTLLLAERVRMQYRLDGADEDWVDATVPRVATYNHLRPGHFVFRVRAWDETGQRIPGEATLAFRVLPTWYQSWWFAVVMAMLVIAILFVIYRLRVRQLARAYNVRLEERWLERTRIARELHDTLLQGFQGLMFHLQAVRDLLPHQPVKAIPVLDTALQKGEEAIDDARSAVTDLRSPERVERDFTAGLAAIASETATLSIPEKTPSWKLETKGRVREIPATVLYELYQIAREAIGNAFRHAHAENISIEVRYGIDSLLIAISDDGVGFDEALLSASRRRGHFGTQGMTERVERLGGEMTLRSRLGEGTRVVLSIPAGVAYRKVAAANGTHDIVAAARALGRG